MSKMHKSRKNRKNLLTEVKTCDIIMANKFSRSG